MLINLIRVPLRHHLLSCQIRNFIARRSASQTVLAKVRRSLPRNNFLTWKTVGCGLGGFAVGTLFVVKAQTPSEKAEELVIKPVEESPRKEFYEDNFSWQRLWELLKPDAGFLLIAVASAFVVALLNIKIPISLGELTNVLSQYVSNNGSPWTWNDFSDSVREPSVKLLAMYLFQGLFTFINISSLTIVGEKLSTRLRQSLFESIMQQDIAFFDTARTGEVVNCTTTDVQDFKSAFKICLSQGLRSITQSIGCAATLYVISPKMTIVMATVVSSLILIGSCLGALLRVMSRRAQNQIGRATAVASEAIGSVRTVRAFAMEKEAAKTYNKEIKISEKLHIELGLGISVFQSLTNVALNGIVLGTLLYGGFLLSANELSAGNLMSFLVATQTVQRSLAQVSLLYGQYMKMVTSGSRVFSFLDMKPAIPLIGGRTLSSPIGEVQFKNITFSYPSRPGQTVLKDLSLHLEPGRVTAVCGLSGAGKSTLAALLERFYDVDSGSVLIDGVNVKDLDPSWLRGRLIGYINQEPTLFAASIKDNIRYGRPDATDEEVFEAAALANADSFIQAFPHGYDTLVGERGVSVSGGQKQRIAIARAILKNPTILVLDEATSALDSQSEKLVQEALERVTKGKTVLIIAHRLSTIRDADVIVVLAGGQLREFGDHKTLIKKKEIYWELVRQQHDSGNSRG